MYYLNGNSNSAHKAPNEHLESQLFKATETEEEKERI